MSQSRTEICTSFNGIRTLLQYLLVKLNGTGIVPSIESRSRLIVERLCGNFLANEHWNMQRSERDGRDRNLPQPLARNWHTEDSILQRNTSVHVSLSHQYRYQRTIRARLNPAPGPSHRNTLATLDCHNATGYRIAPGGIAPEADH